MVRIRGVIDLINSGCIVLQQLPETKNRLAMQGQWPATTQGNLQELIYEHKATVGCRRCW